MATPAEAVQFKKTFCPVIRPPRLKLITSLWPGAFTCISIVTGQSIVRSNGVAICGFVGFHYRMEIKGFSYVAICFGSLVDFHPCR